MKLRADAATEFYVSDAGYLCIKQPDSPYEPVVSLSPVQVKALLRFITSTRLEMSCKYSIVVEE